MIDGKITIEIAVMNSQGDRVERRLAAILAVDVAGYSRLMGADEERDARAVARAVMCDKRVRSRVTR